LLALAGGNIPGLLSFEILEARVGFEPTNDGFADQRLDRFGDQFIAYPAAFHASTPPFSTLTLVKPCSRYFAA
jgi:hypothetical protein